ncbi:hypothetical protein BZG35_09770 [Brevundimonas sp. LM2]|uniref:HlyD family type I secretion periplasmic adaptor subunit n=1 Tax=Brevundimonas sp. LM2 TaxID=1938605 RepID=UPI000983FAD6|nr:HlyD family type I secretion periplasmic adaptor subunit [Brevundimonas sp. LM2]AQR61905.1 hypothetical protein BZG35_09770 [Brevundimonas sp. LM2]
MMKTAVHSVPSLRVNSEATRSLVRPLNVTETYPQRLVRRATLIGSMAVVFAVGWSAVAQVSEVSRGTGVLVPTLRERALQHLEGGRVAAIMVREGEIVKAGQAVVSLADGATPQDLEVARSRAADIQAQIDALEALRSGSRPVTGPQAVGAAAMSAANAVVRGQALDLERAQLAAQSAQVAEATASAAIELSTARRDLELVRQEYDRYRRLADQGLVAGITVAEKERARVAAEGRVQVLSRQLDGSRARLTESRRAMGSFSARSDLELGEQIRVLREGLAEAEGDLAKATERNANLVLRSPVDGIVKDIIPDSLGEVIPAGGRLATIVPVTSPLFAEVEIPADQVSYLKVGQEARVKVTAFDFTRYGWARGRLEFISPSSFVNDQGLRFYRARVALESNTLPRRSGARLLPGMELRVDLITGRKTVLDYLLSPVRRGLDSSFSER